MNGRAKTLAVAIAAPEKLADPSGGIDDWLSPRRASAVQLRRRLAVSCHELKGLARWQRQVVCGSIPDRGVKLALQER